MNKEGLNCHQELRGTAAAEGEGGGGEVPVRAR